MVAAAASNELSAFGIPVGHKNYAAAYATGLLLARRVLKKFDLDEKFKGKEELNGRMDDSAVSIEEEEQCLTTIGDASGQLKKKSKKVKRKTEGL